MSKATHRGGRINGRPRPFHRKRFDHGKPISRIDSRPLVIVALFLAVVFLFPASQLRTHSLLVDLPVGMGSDLAPAYPYITITVSEDGLLAVDDRPSSLAGIAAAIASRNLDVPTVLFSPDPGTDYGTAALVLNEIAKAGVLPSEICFDRLGRFRDFERASFVPALSIVEPTEREDWSTLSKDMLPSGCEQFFEGYDETA